MEYHVDPMSMGTIDPMSMGTIKRRRMEYHLKVLFLMKQQNMEHSGVVVLVHVVNGINGIWHIMLFLMEHFPDHHGNIPSSTSSDAPGVRDGPRVFSDLGREEFYGVSLMLVFSICWFPKMGVPPNYPFQWDFP